MTKIVKPGAPENPGKIITDPAKDPESGLVISDLEKERRKQAARMQAKIEATNEYLSRVEAFALATRRGGSFLHPKAQVEDAAAIVDELTELFGKKMKGK